jgi:hypothetical protein
MKKAREKASSLKLKILSGIFSLMLIVNLMPISAAVQVEEPIAIESKIELQISKEIMLVNGSPIEIDPGKGTVPISKEGHTLVPIRAIIENMGGTVGWDDKEKRIDIMLNGTMVKVWIGKKDAEVNGQSIRMEVAPETINDRTMLPLRFIAENLGAKVEWEGKTQTITIYYHYDAGNNQNGYSPNTANGKTYVDTSSLQNGSEEDLGINLYSNLPKSFPKDFPKDIIPFLPGTEVIGEFNSDDQEIGSGVDRYSAIFQVNNDIDKVMSLYTNYILTLKEYSDDPYYGTDTHRSFYGRFENKEGYYKITILVSKDSGEDAVSVIITIDYLQ